MNEPQAASNNTFTFHTHVTGKVSKQVGKQILRHLIRLSVVVVCALPQPTPAASEQASSDHLFYYFIEFF